MMSAYNDNSGNTNSNRCVDGSIGMVIANSPDPDSGSDQDTTTVSIISTTGDRPTALVPVAVSASSYVSDGPISELIASSGSTTSGSITFTVGSAVNNIRMSDYSSAFNLHSISKDMLNFKLSAAKRIQKELAEMMNDPPPHCSAGLKDNNIFECVSTILGPPNSVYEGGMFYQDIEFPIEYPFRPPKITFRTRIYHCNINSKGSICLDILKDAWSPALTLSKILLSICSLLTDCNPDDPLVCSIGFQYITNRVEHDRMARMWTKRFATE